MEQYLTWSQTEAQHAGNTFLLEPQDAGSNPGGAAGAVTFQIYSPTAPAICIITTLLYNTNVEVVSWDLLSSPKPEMRGICSLLQSQRCKVRFPVSTFFNTTIYIQIDAMDV